MLSSFRTRRRRPSSAARSRWPGRRRSGRRWVCDPGAVTGASDSTHRARSSSQLSTGWFLHQPQRPTAPRQRVNLLQQRPGSPCRWVYRQGTLRGPARGVGAAYARWCGQPFRGARVPHHSPRPPHPRPGGPPAHGDPTRSGAAAQRGRRARRCQRRVLRASSSAARSAGASASRPRRRSRGRCSSTTPNEPTCSTSPGPPTASPPRVGAPSRDPSKAAIAAEPAVGARRRSPTVSRSCATQRQNLLGHQRSRPRVLLPRDRRRWPHTRTSPASSSSTPPPRDFYPDWDAVRRDVRRRSCAPRPAATRTTTGCRNWSASSPRAATTFRRLWAAHDVRTHGAGTKRFNHPVVGELTLAYEELAITAEPGLVLMVYTAEPGSPSAERLRLLASWAATTEAADSAPADPVGRSTRDTEGT